MNSKPHLTILVWALLLLWFQPVLGEVSSTSSSHGREGHAATTHEAGSPEARLSPSDDAFPFSHTSVSSPVPWHRLPKHTLNIHRLPHFRTAPLFEPVLTPYVIKPHGPRADRLTLTCVSLASLNYQLYRQFKNIWWSHPRTRFHFYRGWRRTSGFYDLGPHDSLWWHMDKFGHFYNARLISHLLSDAFSWVGFERSKSLGIGAMLSSLFYLQIELFDGQYEEWGFSLGDFLANEVGALMPILTEEVPALRSITLKWSYHTSEEIGKEKYFIEDYGGMTFWASLDVEKILPHRLKPLWPGFFNLAMGYGITRKAYGEIELYVALDYNLKSIRSGNPFLNRLLTYLDFIHFPAPTLRLRPFRRYWLFYY